MGAIDNLKRSLIVTSCSIFHSSETALFNMDILQILETIKRERRHILEIGTSNLNIHQIRRSFQSK